MEKVLIGIKSVITMTGLTRSRVYEFVKTPGSRFPQPLKIGRSTRWYFNEVQDWAKQLRGDTPAALQVAPAPRLPAERVVGRVSRYDYVLGLEGVFTQVLRSSHLLVSRHPSEWKPEVPIHTTRRERSVPPCTRRRPEHNQVSPDAGRTNLGMNVAVLKQQYEAGATLDQLVEAHRVGKAKLLQLLREAGTSIRPPGPRRKNPHRWPSQ